MRDFSSCGVICGGGVVLRGCVPILGRCFRGFGPVFVGFLSWFCFFFGSARIGIFLGGDFP